MVVILFNSSVPGSSIPASGVVATLLSKGGHVLEYVILAWLAWRALTDPEGGVELAPRSAALAVIFGGLAFAVLDELRQLFVAGRGSSAWDVLLDGASVSVATACLLRTAGEPLPHKGYQTDHGDPAEDGQEQVHRQDLPVGVDVGQEDHHDREVQRDESMQDQRGRA